MIIRFLLLLMAVATPGSAACVTVSGERILAGDMARAVPAFARVPPDAVLGYAPVAGGKRSYDGPELSRLARRYGVDVPPGSEACFVRPLETLTRARIAAVLAKVLPGAGIEILDFSRQPIPPGELRFPLSGLDTYPAAHSPLRWRGMIQAPGETGFPVWASVRIQISGKRVVATENLSPGHPIARAQVREEPYQGPPGFPGLSQVVGRVPRRPIPGGVAIEATWLDAPADVVSGERVTVEVSSGRAFLRFEGQAQASGRRGQVISVRNPSGGKTFRATIVDRGRVALTADGAALPGDER